LDTNPLMKRVQAAITPMTETMGYEIVRVIMVGVGSGTPTLQIMAEKPDGTMQLEDCSRLSQAVSAILDVEDILADKYYLEVSSPGIDRPLTRLKDFDRYKGFETRVELDTPIEGQRKFKGMLKGIDGNEILLEDEAGKAHRLPFKSVEKAKLLLTDALIEAVTKKSGKKKKHGKPGENDNAAEDADDEMDEDLGDGSPYAVPTPKKKPVYKGGKSKAPKSKDKNKRK